jgi:hypothetical protein
MGESTRTGKVFKLLIFMALVILSTSCKHTIHTEVLLLVHIVCHAIKRYTYYKLLRLNDVKTRDIVKIASILKVK